MNSLTIRKREDFTAKTKSILAQRSAYICSNPSCNIKTIGAHSNINKSVSIGRACHIEAASQGGPRYNANMTSEEIKSIENGIWLCATCSDIIDHDVEQFPVDLLKKWKKNSERKINNDNLGGKIESLPRVISICNPAGGTGKSIVSGLLSLAIARKSKKRVLCISATPADQSHIVLGIKKLIMELSLLKAHRFDNSNISVLKSNFNDAVDAIDYLTIDNLVSEQYLIFGTSSFLKIITTLTEKYQYDYIVCDCGGGYENNIVRELLLQGSDVVMPLGQNIHAYSAMKIVSDRLYNAKYNGDVWLLNSIGYLTSNQKMNVAIRNDKIEIINNFRKRHLNIQELKTVVPKNMALEHCILNGLNVFAFNRTLDIAKAYEKLAEELLLSSHN